MGRVLIIIIAMTVGILGVMQINLNSNQLILANRSAGYSNDLQARNVAHAAIDAALHQLTGNPGWRNNFQPYEVELDYGTAYVSMEDMTTNANLSNNQVKLISRVVNGQETIVVTVLAERFVPELPDIRGATTFMDDNFTVNLSGNAFDIVGYDRSGSGNDMAGIALTSNAKTSEFTSRKIVGSPNVGVYSDVDYSSMQLLLDRVGDYATLIEGNIDQGTLGTQASPGVFKIKNYARISGNVEGWGILIADSESELSMSGTLEFNGLILFKNTWEFDGSGNVTINGAIAMGSPDAVTPTAVNISGNLTFNYDSSTLNYAELTAFNTMPPTYVITRYYE